MSDALMAAIGTGRPSAHTVDLVTKATGRLDARAPGQFYAGDRNCETIEAAFDSIRNSTETPA